MFGGKIGTKDVVCVNSYVTGDSVISCCGIILPPLQAEDADNEHSVTIENVEDEHFITVLHPMTKEHFISFIAFVTCDKLERVPKIFACG